MPSWQQLEQMFGELKGPLGFARLDRQTGAAGEFHHVAGVDDDVARARFDSYSRMAGKKLLQLCGQNVPDFLRGAADERTVWFRFLCRDLRFFEYGPVLQDTGDAHGRGAGAILTGSLRQPANVSAARCLEIAEMTNESTEGDKPY